VADAVTCIRSQYFNPHEKSCLQALIALAFQNQRNYNPPPTLW